MDLISDVRTRLAEHEEAPTSDGTLGWWKCLSSWWFQTFFIFTPIRGNDPIWQIFFKWVETTNQLCFDIKTHDFAPVLLWVVLPFGTRLTLHLPQHLSIFATLHRGCLHFLLYCHLGVFKTKIPTVETTGKPGKNSINAGSTHSTGHIISHQVSLEDIAPWQLGPCCTTSSFPRDIAPWFLQPGPGVVSDIEKDPGFGDTVDSKGCKSTLVDLMWGICTGAQE